MKHKDLIIKWANGAKIEFFSELFNKWKLVNNPYWVNEVQYREHIPARTAFEAGKKILARDGSGGCIRLTKDSDFLSEYQYEILEPDDYWKDKFNKGAKLEYMFYYGREWVQVTDKFRWDSNSAYKFREVSQPLVFSEGPIVISAEGSSVRTDVPISFYNLNCDVARIEINITSGIIKFIE